MKAERAMHRVARRLRRLASRPTRALTAWLGTRRPETELTPAQWESLRRRPAQERTSPGAGLTSEERFLFDLEGYLMLRQVLTPSEVAALNAIVTERFPTTPDSPAYRRAFGVVTWGVPFQALIDHPRVAAYLAELVGPTFRLDHDFGILMTTGGRSFNLHGGDTPGAPEQWYRYRDGVIRSGLTVVTYLLSDVNPGDGGFCCIPGSHKSNFPADVPEDVRRYQRRPHYLVQPCGAAGDAILFPEALIHGTLPWRAVEERRALVYKYGPGHSAWTPGRYDLSAFRDLTAQQRRILAPPFVDGRPDSLGPE